jgi:hypothetical protein
MLEKNKKIKKKSNFSMVAFNYDEFKLDDDKNFEHQD